MFNHKKIKIFSNILLFAGIFSHAILDASGSTGRQFVNDRANTIGRINGNVPPNFNGTAGAAAQNGTRGRYNVLAKLIAFLVKINLGNNALFSSLPSNTANYIQGDLLKLQALFAKIGLPLNEAFNIPDNEARANSVASIAIAVRVVMSGFNYEDLANNMLGAQRNQTNVWVLQDSNTLVRANDSITNSVEVNLRKHGKHHVVYAANSSVKAVIYEITNNIGLNIKLTPLLRDMCMDKPGEKTDTQIVNELVQNFNQYIQNVSRDGQNLIAQGQSNIYDLPRSVIQFAKRSSQNFVAKQLEELLNKVSGKLCDFALIFRLKDETVHIGILPIMAGTESAIMAQFDEEGNLNASDSYGGVDISTVLNFNKQVQQSPSNMFYQQPAFMQAQPMAQIPGGFGMPYMIAAR
jgi:hypothetical protein